MSKELLACPFCGTSTRDDEQVAAREAIDRGESTNVKWLQVTEGCDGFHVECFGCGVELRNQRTAEEAIAAWNLRTEQKSKTAWTMKGRDAPLYEHSCGWSGRRDELAFGINGRGRRCPRCSMPFKVCEGTR